jgi:Tol biopolymer transport system component
VRLTAAAAVTGALVLPVAAAGAAPARPLQANAILHVSWGGGATPLFAAEGRGSNGVYRIAPDGSGLRRVSRVPAWAPEWSPRGDAVALMERGSLTIATRSWTSRRRLFRGEVFGVAWSPDGARLAYSAGGALYVSDRSGRRRRLALANDGLVNPAWSPDGRRLAYTSCPTDRLCERSSVYVVDADRPTPSRRRLPGLVAGQPCRLTWAPSRQIAVDDTTGTGIVVVDPRSGRRRAVAGGSCPVWSPDGRTLAGTGAVVAGPSDRRFRRVVSLPRRDDGAHPVALPVWSGDGRMLLFSWAFGDAARHRYRLYVVDVEHRRARVLVETPPTG